VYPEIRKGRIEVGRDVQGKVVNVTDEGVARG
jgi:hypothetical protein